MRVVCFALSFGGVIWVGSPSVGGSLYYHPSNYYILNFNDLGSAMCTLFALLVVNNWSPTDARPVAERLPVDGTVQLVSHASAAGFTWCVSRCAGSCSWTGS